MQQAPTLVHIATAFIELDKLLKRENLAASGGAARWMISQGQVQVNGAVELRKRRKLLPGDLVSTGGTSLLITGSVGGAQDVCITE